LDVSYGHQGGVREEIIVEELKLDKFVNNIRHIHLQVHEIFKKSPQKYKSQHDQHRIKKTFKVRDRVWLHINKEKARRYC
jgi:hypothetical protein